METKLAIIYTGKSLGCRNSKVARYFLTGKTVFADITDSYSFGKAARSRHKLPYLIKMSKLSGLI